MVFYIYKLHYSMGIFYVLFIYVLQGYFGNWTKKSRWRLWSSVWILPLLRTTGPRPPDVRTAQKLVSQFCPSNGIVSSRAYLRHSSKQQEEQERIEREEIIPKEIKSLLYLLWEFVSLEFLFASKLEKAYQTLCSSCNIFSSVRETI